MRIFLDSSAPPIDACNLRRGIARRVADAHAALGDAALLALVSGSVVDGTADEQSDVDMSIVLSRLPDVEAPLEAACAAAGGSAWFWRPGSPAEAGLVVAFRMDGIDGIEVQIGYTTHDKLASDLDELLLRHNPDTPLHKLGEGLLKAEALASEPLLASLKLRLAAFPPALGRAMVEHFLATPTPWRAIAQIGTERSLLHAFPGQAPAQAREQFHACTTATCGAHRRHPRRACARRFRAPARARRGRACPGGPAVA